MEIEYGSLYFYLISYLYLDGNMEGASQSKSVFVTLIILREQQQTGFQKFITLPHEGNRTCSIE